MNFSLGRCFLELAQKLSGVALAWHFARRSAPFGVTMARTQIWKLGYKCFIFQLHCFFVFLVWPGHVL
jgi:hypothetical protein